MECIQDTFEKLHHHYENSKIIIFIKCWKSIIIILKGPSWNLKQFLTGHAVSRVHHAEVISYLLFLCHIVKAMIPTFNSIVCYVIFSMTGPHSSENM